MENNKAMIKIFKNSKMKFELKKKKHFLYKNQYVDMVGYFILNKNNFSFINLVKRFYIILKKFYIYRF